MVEKQKTAVLSDKQQEELENKLRKASHEDRIPCASALAIAKSMKIPAAEIGKTANKLKIRIQKCQLGCF